MSTSSNSSRIEFKGCVAVSCFFSTFNSLVLYTTNRKTILLIVEVSANIAVKEAHVCICFVAYKVYKELERILRINGITMSVDKVLSIAKTITTIKIKLQKSKETMTKTMLLTDKHKSIAKLFENNFWEKV